MDLSSEDSGNRSVESGVEFITRPGGAFSHLEELLASQPEEELVVLDRRKQERRRVEDRRHADDRREKSSFRLFNRRKLTDRRKVEDRRHGIDRRVFDLFAARRRQCASETKESYTCQHNVLITNREEATSSRAVFKDITVDRDGSVMAYSYRKDPIHLRGHGANYIELHSPPGHEVRMVHLDMQNPSGRAGIRTDGTESSFLTLDNSGKEVIYVLLERDVTLHLGDQNPISLFVGRRADILEGENRFQEGAASPPRARLVLHNVVFEDIRQLSARRYRFGLTEVELGMGAYVELEVTGLAEDVCCLSGPAGSLRFAALLSKHRE